VPAAAREHLLQVRLLVDAGRQRMLDLLGEGLDDGVLDSREALLEEERAQSAASMTAASTLRFRASRSSSSSVCVGVRTLDEALPEAELPGNLRAGHRETTCERTFASLPSEKSGWSA
jgi:hypothetical protein